MPRRPEILPDEALEIADRLRHFSDNHSIDLVLTVGGAASSRCDTRGHPPGVERFTPGLDGRCAVSLAKTPPSVAACSGIRARR